MIRLVLCLCPALAYRVEINDLAGPARSRATRPDLWLFRRSAPRPARRLCRRTFRFSRWRQFLQQFRDHRMHGVEYRNFGRGRARPRPPRWRNFRCAGWRRLWDFRRGRARPRPPRWRNFRCAGWRRLWDFRRGRARPRPPRWRNFRCAGWRRLWDFRRGRARPRFRHRRNFSNWRQLACSRGPARLIALRSRPLTLGHERDETRDQGDAGDDPRGPQRPAQ